MDPFIPKDLHECNCCECRQVGMSQVWGRIYLKFDLMFSKFCNDARRYKNLWPLCDLGYWKGQHEFFLECINLSDNFSTDFQIANYFQHLATWIEVYQGKMWKMLSTQAHEWFCLFSWKLGYFQLSRIKNSPFVLKATGTFSFGWWDLPVVCLHPSHFHLNSKENTVKCSFKGKWRYVNMLADGSEKIFV